MAETVKQFQYPKRVPGCECPICTRALIPADLPADAEPIFQKYRIQKVNLDGTTRDLTEEEWAQFEGKYTRQAEWKQDQQAKHTWHKACSKIIKQLYREKAVAIFNIPVDPVAHKVPDYHNIVKHPMDLGTIKAKLEASGYTDPEDFVSDVRMVFRNAFLYNKEGTYVRNMAGALSLIFEKECARLRGLPVPN